MALLALAPLALTACASSRPIRGVERADTRRPRNTAGGERSRFPSCRGRGVGGAWVAQGFCLTRIAEDLDRPRDLVVAPNGDVFVNTRRGVVVLWDGDGDGESSDDERTQFGAGSTANHGIALSPDGRFLYYATDSAVFRVPYSPGLRGVRGPGEVVVRELPGSINHVYKTITFDREGRLYVSNGSAGNIEVGPGGATIMRYTVPDTLPPNGMRWDAGERFAVGIRNAVGLAWDGENRLWAVVNGRDWLHPPGTGENFYLDHPGDWIFRLSNTPGTFYGFPYCWVLGTVPWGERRDPTSHWADPDAAEGRTDAWCQDPANVHPAAGALPAHSAPLGAVIYNGSLFPSEYRGNLFVTAHGSWNRHGAQIGRTILRLVTEGDRVVRSEVVLGERSGNGNLHEGDWSERPVGIAQAPDGSLVFTSDERGHVFRLGYTRE